MESSSPEAIPLKLPVPPSTPSLPPPPQKRTSHNDPVLARAMAALEDDDAVPSSLDVHVRWVVESGSIVQKGEKLAQLFYSFHGAPPPPPSAVSLSATSNGNAIVRARMKNKRRPAPGSTLGPLEKAQMQQSGPKGNHNFVTLDVRSPHDGFLRVLYKKPCAFNAIQINQSYSAVNLILAAIEPCEHPAVVGSLCAVCGADIRASKGDRGRAGGPIHRQNPWKQHRQTSKIPSQEVGGTVPTKPVDPRKQQIIETQKKLASSIASVKEEDEELANFDMDAAIASHAGGTKKSSSHNATNPAPNPAPEPKVTKPAARAPATTRSLSSLLSGAKATQQMQQNPAKRKALPTKGFVASQRPRPTATSSAASPALDDSDSSRMSKMTVSGGVTITISESEARNISEASSKKLREERKLCLVLDLDHTLLHATDDYRAGKYVADEVLVESGNGDKDAETKGDASEAESKSKEARRPNPDIRADVRSILLPVELPPAQQQQYVQQKLEQQKQDETHFCLSPLPQQKKNSHSIIMRHFVKLRPHLKEFFAQIQPTYQLSVYTAGTRTYAEQVAVMICRHLVGATLDEEGLNELRAKVREKDEECKRYQAKLGRKRQLERARERKDTEGNKGAGDKKAASQKVVPKKSVSFTANPESRAGSSITNGGNSDGSKSNASSSAIREPIVITIDDDGECTAPPAASGNGDVQNPRKKKRTTPVGVLAPTETDLAKEAIPRKKKKLANSGSLLTLLPTKTDSGKKVEADSENLINRDEALTDPSEERNRLRTELEEAEKLEIAAVELRRKMFGSRIVSRTDVGDLGKDVKSLKRVFPCGGVMAAILDDREDVWANAKNNATGRPGEPPDNLLLVKPYHWEPFRGFADVNNASGRDLSKPEDPQCITNEDLGSKEDDVQLLWTADILRRLHERYYSTALSREEREGVTVPKLLKSMRKETFFRSPRVKVVFSGLIPINRQNKRTQIRPHVVRYAEELGAEVLPAVNGEVTHVVAARDGSDKIKQARWEVPGCFVVHTSWLMDCYWSVSRRDVRPHHMGPMPSRQRAREPAGSFRREAQPKNDWPKQKPLLLLDDDEEESDEDDDDDDDFEDDFAADLEKEMMEEE
ncbi:hypothetical protein ACHAWF_016904 [Thalassiosira exigua]